MKRAVIVGGGIAGLAAAYYLRALSQREGVQLEVVLLEKERRAGGCILTERAEGFVVEGGPDCLYAEKPWGLELCREIGLGDQLVEACHETRGTYILWDGQLHPLPEGFFLLVPTALSPFLRSRLLSWRAKLRVALEPLVPRRKGQGDESLASFVLRRLGREVLEKVAEPLIAGIHAAEPETMSLRATFPRFADLESRYGSLLLGLWKVRRKASPANRPYKVPFVSLRGGMGEMVEGILEHLPPESMRLGEEVLAVEREGGRYRVRGRGGTWEADYLILATPSHVSSRLLQGLDQWLSETLLMIPYSSTATVSLAYEAQEVLPLLRGHGFVVPRREGRRLMAVTFSSRKFPSRAPEGKVLIRAFIGGAKDEGAVLLDDEELLRLVMTELREILGIRSRPLHHWIFRFPASMAQYRVGHEGRVRALEERIKEHPGLFLTGGAFHGIGISDCCRQGKELAERVLGLEKGP